MVSASVWSKLEVLRLAALPLEICEDVIVVLEQDPARRDPASPYILILKFCRVTYFGWRNIA